MSSETVSDIGTIVNVRSFRLDKNPGVVSIFNRRLWGFSKRYRRRWNFLDKGVRVLFYGDKGIRMAARIEGKSESSEPVEEWISNPTGYPYHIIVKLINEETEKITPITKDELVDVYGIPLAKKGFYGTGLTVFGVKPKETPGITYPIEKFNEIWNKFLERNSLHDLIKPTDIEDRIKTYVNKKSKLISKFPNMSEADTISTIVEPLLEDLGWEIIQLDEIQRQYPVKGRKGIEWVDLALKLNGQPKVFIEVKSVGTTLDESDELQVINYAFNEGVDWCVLTNGREIRVYGAFLGRTTEQRLLFRLAIEEYEKNLDKLMLISKENIQQKLVDWAKRRYATKMIKTWIQKNEERLVEDIAKQTNLEKEKVQEAFKRFMANLK